jgi:hypothetical protein
MKNYIAIIMVLILAISFDSCQDQLDIKQKGVLSTDVYYGNATDNEALTLIVAVYKATGGIATGGSDWLTLLHELSDDGTVTSNSIYGGASKSDFAANSYFTDFYAVNYKCNLIIEKMKEDSEAKKRIMGEAYFWRAWANLNLIRAWGTPPLVDHVLLSTELKPANGNPSELWNLVFSSLEEAIKRLPEKSSVTGQIALGARVSKQSALALLGKAHVCAGDYSGAIKPLSDVINSNLYDLVSDYSSLYRPQDDFCPEYMWEWNANDADVTMRSVQAQWQVNYINWASLAAVMPGGVHLSGYNVGYGEMAYGSSDLWNFLSSRELNSKRQLGTIWNYDQILNKYIDLSSSTTLAQHPLNYEGTNMKHYTGLGMSEKEAAANIFWNDFTQSATENCQGIFRAKMYCYHEDMYPSTGGQDIWDMANWPGMRYSEVLLLYAEACKQAGSSESLGLNALNKVRIRAGLSALGSYTLQDVKDEKRAELAFEGERFFDLVRWGDAQKVISNANRGKYKYIYSATKSNYANPNVTQQAIGNYVGYSSKFALFPFPYTEMTLNSNLAQNPGW